MRRFNPKFLVLAFAMCAIGGAAGPLASALADPFPEHSTNRWGADYQVLTVGDGARGCAWACADDQNCMAWTFERPRAGQPRGLCRLKNAVPEGQFDPCCVSGVSLGNSAKTAARTAGFAPRGAMTRPVGAESMKMPPMEPEDAATVQSVGMPDDTKLPYNDLRRVSASADDEGGSIP